MSVYVIEEGSGGYAIRNTRTLAVVAFQPTFSNATKVAARLNQAAERVIKRVSKTPHSAPDRPELDALMQRSVEAFAAMPPEEQEAHRRKQRESWVRGNIGIDRDTDARQTIPSHPAPCCGCAARAETLARVAEHFRAYVATLARNGVEGAERAIEEAVRMTGGGHAD